MYTYSSDFINISSKSCWSPLLSRQPPSLITCCARKLEISINVLSSISRSEPLRWQLSEAWNVTCKCFCISVWRWDEQAISLSARGQPPFACSDILKTMQTFPAAQQQTPSVAIRSPGNKCYNFFFSKSRRYYQTLLIIVGWNFLFQVALEAPPRGVRKQTRASPDPSLDGERLFWLLRVPYWALQGISRTWPGRFDADRAQWQHLARTTTPLQAMNKGGDSFVFSQWRVLCLVICVLR